MKYFLLVCFTFFAFENVKAQDDQTISITISPVHLAFPIVEITVESKRENKQGSIAGIVGYGFIDDHPVINFLDLGVQYNHYVLGDFQHGIQVGAEAMYTRIANYYSEESDAEVYISPHIGYKYVADFGFTVNIQGGYYFSTGEINLDPVSSNIIRKDSGVNINLNTGWSF